jgi:hypothetical protein
MRVDLDEWIERVERLDGPTGPWVDPDRPDEVLDRAYVSGIVPKAQRIVSNFICPIANTRGAK